MSLRELIGKECAVVFNLEPQDWPFPGYPAWLVVEDVDLPLVKMCYRCGSGAQWVNASLIKTIEVSE